MKKSCSLFFFSILLLPGCDCVRFLCPLPPSPPPATCTRQISEYKAAVRASWSKIETAGDAPNQVFHKRLAEQDAAVAELFNGTIDCAIAHLFVGYFALIAHLLLADRVVRRRRGRSPSFPLTLT